MNSTIVTAFFDIEREQKGDGRKLNEYFNWIKQTLKLNCNLFVITEDRFYNFFVENRPYGYPMFIKLINFKESEYYQYYEKITNVLNCIEYKQRVAYPNRVECVLPEYNILQYSKFHYLQMAIEENPFHSDYFFWMDAGASRFFNNLDVNKFFPSNTSFLNTTKFFAQCRSDIYNYNINENFIWEADNLIYGGMFGGYKDIVLIIKEKTKNVFEWMLIQNNVNNEQLALALVWKDNKELFQVFDRQNIQILLFELLS